jgi:hypothetical protein
MKRQRPAGYVCEWEAVRQSPAAPVTHLRFLFRRVRVDGKPWVRCYDFDLFFAVKTVRDCPTFDDLHLAYPWDADSYFWKEARRPASALRCFAESYPIARDWLLDLEGE